MTSNKICSLKTEAFSDISASFPKRQPFEKNTPEHLDLFIMAKGFEERILKIPAELIERSIISSSTKILIGNYKTNVDDNNKRFSQLSELTSDFQFNEFDAENPAITKRTISSAINATINNIDKPVVGVDISGSSSTLIFSILNTLFTEKSDIYIWIFYAEAKNYFPDADNNNALKLAQNCSGGQSNRDYGASEIMYHDHFRGIQGDNRESFVIGVPSYSLDRFQRCVQHLGDDIINITQKVFALILPSTTDTHHAHRSDDILNHVRKFFLNDNESARIFSPDLHQCDVENYDNITRTLIEIADINFGRNITLIHFGPKLQSVGASLALLARPEIRLLMSRPTNFNATEYSNGVGNIWSIFFQNPKKLIKKLQTIGHIRIQSDERLGFDTLGTKT